MAAKIARSCWRYIQISRIVWSSRITAGTIGNNRISHNRRKLRLCYFCNPQPIRLGNGYLMLRTLDLVKIPTALCSYLGTVQGIRTHHKGPWRNQDHWYADSIPQVQRIIRKLGVERERKCQDNENNDRFQVSLHFNPLKTEPLSSVYMLSMINIYPRFALQHRTCSNCPW